MKKGCYKTFQLTTKAIEKEGCDVFLGTLKLPKNVEFLSLCADSCSFQYEPIFCISVLGDFTKPNEFIKYDFMVIWHRYDQNVEISSEDYEYIGLALLRNGNSITSLKNFDIFVKKT